MENRYFTYGISLMGYSFVIMRNYNNYKVWIESHALVQFIYKNIVPAFPQNEQYELAKQLKRAAYSVPFNIVEGSGRSSEKDFAHFLDISFGSLLEVEYCCLLAKDLAYLNVDQYKILNGKISSIKAMLIGLIKSIREPVNEKF